MSSWAEIDDNNIVLRVLVGDNNDPNGDEGYQWFVDNLGGRWVKTSYNSFGGKRRDPNTGEVVNDNHFRYNYACIGFTYDKKRDAFIPPKPYASWVLNEATCLWDAPVAYPSDGNVYVWDEALLDWVEANNLLG